MDAEATCPVEIFKVGGYCRSRSRRNLAAVFIEQRPHTDHPTVTETCDLPPRTWVFTLPVQERTACGLLGIKSIDSETEQTELSPARFSLNRDYKEIIHWTQRDL
ncbi:hypothetical protein BaRGS_00022814 [Batillaria attramentaria]|uniref:Uncharacterized protein n=1 Tax=Batillaria attramentaria TaxID=370345 RepID=A0ABD0KFF2_9CAEN